MASLIKNQILKHLSKFTKNLSPDKVQLSALKGEAELKNLVLDENVLTDVLELPSWLQLTKAVCNRVSVKIQWTKLKSTPIVIVLDEVIVEMETCDILRNATLLNRPSYSSGGAYGFSDKVVDGMTVNVNSVTINFKSKSFYASVQLSRIRLESRTPAWKRGNLQMTRVKDTDRGEVLIFKELDWQLLRVEAQALKDGNIDEEVTPLRLITNQARCRITIKKKLIDCSVVSSRLVLILDDLVWVLTDSQIHQALAFINSFSSLIKQSTELSQKVKGARKLENLPEYMAQMNQMSRKVPINNLSSKSKLFAHYDVVETSYHLYSSRLDLHLCDEGSQHGHTPSLPQLANGGALQIILTNLSVDYYPYHLANGERKHWLRYNESITQRKTWVQSLMNNFNQHLVDLISLPQQSRTHTPLHRAGPHLPDENSSNSSQMRQNADASSSNGYTNICSQWKATVQSNLKKLMSSSFIFRIEDVTVYKVSTGNSKQKPQVFLSRSDFVLPQDVSLVHVEHTMYYYPGGINFPVPAPNLYVNLSPLLLVVDVTSMLWLNAFGLELQQSKIFQESNETQFQNYIDIKIEALMPKISIEGDSLPDNQPDRPSALYLQSSRVIATNCRDTNTSSKISLAKCFNSYGFGSLFFESGEFPSLESDFVCVPEPFIEYALGKDNSFFSLFDQAECHESTTFNEKTLKQLFAKLSPNLLWTECRNIWSLFLDPFWAEFSTIGGSKKKPVPFVDAFPLTLWIYSHEAKTTESIPDSNTSRLQRPSHKLLKEYYVDKVRADKSTTSKQFNKPMAASSSCLPVADMYSVAHITSLVNIQLNHYQFLFLMRTVDKFTKLTELLVQDTLTIAGNSSNLKNSICFSALVPEVQLSLLIATDNGQAKSDSSSRNSSSIDLSLGQDRLQTVNQKNSLSYSQGSSQLVSDLRSLPEISKCLPDSLESPSHKQAFSKVLHRSQNDMVTDVTVNIDSTYLVGSQKQCVDDTRSLHSCNDDFDATSLKSDLSSDSEQYVMVDYENHPVELALLSRSNLSSPRAEARFEPRFEVANEIKDDCDVSSSLDDEKKSSYSSESRNNMYQILTVAINQLQVIQQSSGPDTIVKLGCNNFDINQNSQPESWQSFQDIFSAKGRSWKEKESSQNDKESSKAVFKLRLESGPNAAESYQEPCINSLGHLAVVSSDLDLKLKMSVVTGLLDMIEDEIIPEPPIMPIRLKVNNTKVHLDEDRPLFNITSPGPVPVDISVNECFINRDSQGVFHINLQDDLRQQVFSMKSCQTVINAVGDFRNSQKSLHNETSTSSIETVFSSYEDSHKLPISQNENVDSQLLELQEQNEQLTFKLISFTALEEENIRLKEQMKRYKLVMSSEKSEDPPSALDNAKLMMKLLETQDEVKRLENEKKSLQATMQLLQNSLDKYESKENR